MAQNRCISAHGVGSDIWRLSSAKTTALAASLVTTTGILLLNDHHGRVPRTNPPPTLSTTICLGIRPRNFKSSGGRQGPAFSPTGGVPLIAGPGSGDMDDRGRRPSVPGERRRTPWQITALAAVSPDRGPAPASRPPA